MVLGASIDEIEKIYRARGRDFFRFALATTGDPELANEAVQEGFARAIKGRSTFAGRGHLAAWIARCVLNAAHDVARQDAVRVSPVEDSAVEIGMPDHVLRTLIRELPLRQREALFLRFYLDLDYASIAATLEIEVGTVSATLHAARERLARTLQEVTA